MVRPAAFAFNPQTAESNRFMHADAALGGAAAERAREEFEALAQSLRSEGIGVCVAEDSPTPIKPDAVFPNNWVSFHSDGTVVLYPMQAENRRLERRPEILAQVRRDLDFQVRRTLDLTQYEASGRYLEGTGSLVLDHVHRIAYACRSPRTDAELVEAWGQALGYEPVVFDAVDRAGVPLYHTNVILSIGTRAAVVGAEAIVPRDRARVLEQLRASQREIIQIGFTEIEAFGGNVLELATWDEAVGDATVLVLSASARGAFAEPGFARLAACVDTVLTVPVPTIERLAGGSVRCMLAEVFA
jgi:hypothetical protein